mmetsp:Transcript_6232/g.11120  ORF Transcript_6232/g.11120 Transcript_6232/m.11120 type:complete len:86 (+) Transcript_6232:325-582(+)
MSKTVFLTPFLTQEKSKIVESNAYNYSMHTPQSIFFATACTESTKHPITSPNVTNTPPTIPTNELKNTNQFSLDSRCLTANGVKS